MSKPRSPRWGSSTLAIHCGEKRHHSSGPVATPIVRTANFTFPGTAEMKRWAQGKSEAFVYTRYGNPTLAVAETQLAALEGGQAAVVTASGTAAISSALLAVLKAGDEFIATRQLYGGSYRLFRDILPNLGIHVRYVEDDLAGVEKLVTPRTRALYIETPTNPALRLVDLRKAAALARRYKLVSLVDSTFATPILQRPLETGFDLVLHSATKYLAGHSDVISGAIVGSQRWVNRARQMVIHLGGCMDPDAAFLLVRGIKTLELRVRRHCDNAMGVARFLSHHRRVSRVHYPGLESHPDHRLARRQMSGFGGMLAFDLKGGLREARQFCDRVRVFLVAASLGGVESLAVLPMYTSHYGMSLQELAAAGITPGTVRLSVGLENQQDLLEDLQRALA